MRARLALRQCRLTYAARVGAMVSLREAAKRADVSPSTLSRLECGEVRHVDLDVLARLADLYGVSVADVIEFVDDDEERPA